MLIFHLYIAGNILKNKTTILYHWLQTLYLNDLLPITSLKDISLVVTVTFAQYCRITFGLYTIYDFNLRFKVFAIGYFSN